MQTEIDALNDLLGGPTISHQFAAEDLRRAAAPLRTLGQGWGTIDREEVRSRASRAMARKLPDFRRCINDASEWAIIGGGPSINDHVGTIRQLKRRGVNIVSVNKSHDWLLEHGITPWGHILLDPKERVAEYVLRPRLDVRYFVASQCHDRTFEALNGCPVFLWHAGQDFREGPEPMGILQETWPTTPWTVVVGATTVGLRATDLGHAMGADNFHLFGLDGSRSNGKMHAYDKPEPDGHKGPITLTHKGKRFTFLSNAHMAQQQRDFDQLIEEYPKRLEMARYRKAFDLTVYGSGLLPTAAAIVGWHADPECNRDPSKVGGYVRQEDIAPQRFRELTMSGSGETFKVTEGKASDAA